MSSLTEMIRTKQNGAEILLDDRGVCNLTEVNLMAFVDENGNADYEALKNAVLLATRIGLRQTNVTLDLPEWDKIQKRDRLVGVSLDGVMDFVDAVYDYQLDYINRDAEGWPTGDGLPEEFVVFLEALRLEAQEEARLYAKEMRVPEPLLAPTIKPSGTISKLPGISSGVHRARAPYYIRRVRITSSDPLARVMLDAGYPVYPENDSNGHTVEEYQLLTSWDKWEVLNKANTWVIEFPMHSTTKVGVDDEPAIDQLQRYLLFQEHWTDHNTSITINFAPDEVDALIDMILEHWDSYVAVSFLPKNTRAYPLLPEEPISQAEYLERSAALSHINAAHITKMLREYEHSNMADEDLDPSCSTGVCPTR